MTGPLDFPPVPPAADPANGAGSTKVAIYLTAQTFVLAQDDAALAFSILATATAICGSANGHPSDAMINQFAACMPIGRDLWLDMQAEDDDAEVDLE